MKTKIMKGKSIPTFEPKNYPKVTYERDVEYYFVFNDDWEHELYDCEEIPHIPAGTTPISVIDHIDSNPKLHLFYVKQACKALTTIYDAMDSISALGSTSMMGPLASLHAAVNRLLLEDMAYRDAHELIFSIRRDKNA